MKLLLSVLLSVVLSICIIFSAILLFCSNCTEMLTAYGCPAYDTIGDYADGIINGNADADASLHSGHISIKLCVDQIADQKTFDMLMQNCLLKANTSAYKSIAFPALGTGNLKYPMSEVARMMFANVKKFERGNPISSITDVIFVCYDEDTLKVFEHEQQKEKIDLKTATVTVYQGDIVKICVNAMVKLRKAKEMKKKKVELKEASRNCASEFTIDLNLEDQSSDLKSKIDLVFRELSKIHQHSVVLPVNELGNIQKVSAAFINVFQDLEAKYKFDVHLVVNDGNMVQTFVNCLRNAMNSKQIQ